MRILIHNAHNSQFSHALLSPTNTGNRTESSASQGISAGARCSSQGSWARRGRYSPTRRVRKLVGPRAPLSSNSVTLPGPYPTQTHTHAHTRTHAHTHMNSLPVTVPGPCRSLHGPPHPISTMATQTWQSSPRRLGHSWNILH